jgi:hypothetical protein
MPADTGRGWMGRLLVTHIYCAAAHLDLPGCASLPTPGPRPHLAPGPGTASGRGGGEGVIRARGALTTKAGRRRQQERPARSHSPA